MPVLPVSDYSAFVSSRSEIQSLVSDLGLIPKGSPEYFEHLRLCLNSRFAKVHFCDLYRSVATQCRKERESFSRLLSQRNRRARFFGDVLAGNSGDLF